MREAYNPFDDFNEPDYDPSTVLPYQARPPADHGLSDLTLRDAWKPIDLSAPGIRESDVTSRPERLKALSVTMKDLLLHDGVHASVDGEASIVSLHHATVLTQTATLYSRLARFPASPQQSEPLVGIIFTSPGATRSFRTVAAILAPLTFTENDADAKFRLYSSRRPVKPTDTEPYLGILETIVERLQQTFKANNHVNSSLTLD